MLILLAGLAIRIILAPLLSYPFDITYWGIIIENAQSGNGLYDLSGFFYTPVWGYILNAEAYILNCLGTLDLFGIRFEDLLGLEITGHPYYSATITTPEFNVAIKLPLIAVDAVVGYLIYRMVLEDTGNYKKAGSAFAIWFLCPITIYMSGVQAQFDCISAMLALAAVILVRKEHWFIGGFAFAVAALTKFFPAFLIFIFVEYLLKKNGGMHRSSIKPLLLSVTGAIIACLLIYLPTLLDGTLVYSLSFIFSRASESMSLSNALLFYGRLMFCLAIILLAAYTYWKKPIENSEKDFLRYCLITLSAAGMMNTGPQYCIVFLPLLAYYTFAYDRRMLPWFLIIVITATLSGIINNGFSLLAMASEYYGWIDPETVVDLTSWHDGILLGHRYQTWMICIDESIMIIAMIFSIAFQGIELMKNVHNSKVKKLHRLLNKIMTFGRGNHTDAY